MYMAYYFGLLARASYVAARIAANQIRSILLLIVAVA